MMNHRQRRRTGLTALLLAAATALAGCNESNSAQAGGAETSAEVLAAAADTVNKGYQGTYGAPPTSGPKPATGKDIWIVSAFQQVHALVYQVDRTVEAAKALGWTTHVCDGQNNVNNGWSTCVRQAVAARTDGIVLVSVDCAPVRQALVEAKQARITVASFSGFDCDDRLQGGGSALIDAPARHLPGSPGIADYYRELGRLRANFLIDATKGRAKILHVAFQGVTFGEYLSKGFTDEIARCGGCSIVDTVNVAPSDVPNLRQKFETAFLRVPEATAVAVDVDFFFTVGIQQALAAANRPKLTVLGGECQLEDLGYIRGGKGEEVCVGASSGYRAYGTVDALNRVFNGQPVVPSGAGFQLVDKDHNLPAEGANFDGPVDYRDAYRKLWGV